MDKMKRFLLALVTVMLCGMGAMAAGSAQATFREKLYDFGYIKEDKGSVSHYFEFVNTGDSPLIITRVTASCGCTRPEFPTKPIKPGKKAKIKVTFSPVGRSGSFTKQIKVFTTGSEKRTVLVITGTVVPANKKK